MPGRRVLHQPHEREWRQWAWSEVGGFGMSYGGTVSERKDDS